MILLDTHVLVWLDEGAPALGPAARAHADLAMRGLDLAVSAVSFWELAMLSAKGRLGVRRPLGAWRRGLIDMGVRELPVDGEIAMAAGELDDLHGGPADRFIVATALREGATLMTADRKILDWPGELRRIDGRL